MLTEPTCGHEPLPLPTAEARPPDREAGGVADPLDVEAVRREFPALHQEVRPGVPLVRQVFLRGQAA